MAAKGVALVVGTLAFVTTFMVLVPDGNDYAQVTARKHAWLAADQARKIVFVGGSNLAYGLDSQLVEQATGLRTVNMGMNGYLGVRFMLEEVKPDLREGDVVVLSFEYDSFVKSVDGTGSDLLMVSKARPGNLRFLTWSQRLEVLLALPFAAQQKLLRVVREGGRSVRGVADEEDELDLDSIETLGGFNSHGDLTKHLGITWPRPREQGLDLTELPLDPELVPLLRDFAKEMQARGVAVKMSYGPVLVDFYAKHQAAVDRLHEALSAAAPVELLGKPSDFVLPEPLFFDTVFHLTAEGRAQRTAKVVEQLGPYLKK